MNILQKPLPRRTFLRGLGATMALPFLDSMARSSTAARAAGQAPVRLGYIYRPNGMPLTARQPTSKQ